MKGLVKTFSGFVTKNSTSILTGMSVTGLVTTTIMACKATPKAISLIQDATEEINKDIPEWNSCRQLTKKEILAVTWKCYLPAVIVGGLTAACIISANSINLRRNAVLAGLYSLSETALKEYQSKVIETIGQEKEKEIRSAVHHERIVRNPVSDNEIIITGNGEILCYESLSGRYFKSDKEHIKSVLNDLSRDMMSESTVSLNQVYSELGLRGTKIGEMIGWHIDDGLIVPYFSSQLTENGQPCLVLDFETEPRMLKWD